MRINTHTHTQNKLVDSYILNYESAFKLVNKAFWFAMAFLQDRELHEYWVKSLGDKVSSRRWFYQRWCRWYGYRSELQNERTSWQGTSSLLRHKKMFCMVRAWNCENMITGKNMSHEAVLKIVVKDIIVPDSIRFLGKLVVVRANYLLEYT